MANSEAIKKDVQQKMTAAMKSGDKLRTQVLRMLLSEIKRVEADKPEADATQSIAAYAKVLKRSMAEFEKLNQPQKVVEIQSEVTIVEEFLPKQMDDAGLEQLVDQVLGTLSAPPAAKDAGRLMGLVMKAAAAAGESVDAGRVKEILGRKIPQ